jgi:hypothetical protein
MSRQSYAQSLLKLGLPVGDPIVELGSTWAAGKRASPELIRQAIASAERWRANRDKFRARRMNSVINRLTVYLSHVERRKPIRPVYRSTQDPRPEFGDEHKRVQQVAQPTVQRALHIIRSLEDRKRTLSRKEGSLSTRDAALLKWIRNDIRQRRKDLAEWAIADRGDVYVPPDFDPDRFHLVFQDKRNPQRRRSKRSREAVPRVARGHVTYSGHGVYQDKRRRALDRIRKQETRDRENPKRGAYFVHDPYMGEFLEFGSVRSAARYAKNRFGCDPAADCVFVEDDEALVPIGSLRKRSNPYPHEHSARLIDPQRMIKTSFRRKNVKGGSIGLIMAKRTSRGPMTLQSVRFRAAHFSPTEAKSWLRKHQLSPILFEPATKSRKAAWKAEGVRRKRSTADPGPGLIDRVPYG